MKATQLTDQQILELAEDENTQIRHIFNVNPMQSLDIKFDSNQPDSKDILFVLHADSKLKHQLQTNLWHSNGAWSVKQLDRYEVGIVYVYRGMFTIPHQTSNREFELSLMFTGEDPNKPLDIVGYPSFTCMQCGWDDYGDLTELEDDYWECEKCDATLHL